MASVFYDFLEDLRKVVSKKNKEVMQKCEQTDLAECSIHTLAGEIKLWEG